MNRGLFLDRDGVINEDYGYVHRVKDFRFREGIFHVCRMAQRARMKIIVVTNQAGIGRGYYTHEQYMMLTEFMLTIFSREGVCINQVYCCPYHEDCGLGHYKQYSYDRKPSPGMLVKACSKFNINPFHSIMIGDSPSDMRAAYSIGIRLFVDSGSKNWVEESVSIIQG